MNHARTIRGIGLIGCAIALLVGLAFAWLWRRIEQSRPPLDGEWSVPGLTASTTIGRDDQGVVIITAANRLDAARALGFAHGQDRFFQMDLARRRAAGELAQLLGEAALPLDRTAVGHRFRRLAHSAMNLLPDTQRHEIEAYAAGVNAGLSSLPRPPWEYAFLPADPAPWLPEDCGLVFYSMVLELQNSTGAYEQSLNTLRDVLGEVSVDFFNPLIGPHDSAFDGSQQPLRAPPSEAIIDLRTDAALPAIAANQVAEERFTVGSNAVVIAGEDTAHGAALVAGDPHLGLKIPNLWYRAQLNWPRSDGTRHQVNGVSLPGVPGILIGSNGHIAWTYTNATVDTGDLVPIDLNQIAPEILYHHRGESIEFEERTDPVHGPDGLLEEVPSTWTLHGPIVGRTIQGKPLAYRWTFHDPAALNFDLLDLATAETVDEAIALAATSGMPNQNLLVADIHGDAAWTLTGKLPRRVGFDGRFPVAWTFGDRYWDGYLSADERPVVRAQSNQPLWSGNQRKVSGADLARIGDAGYDQADRASQIHRRLRDLTIEIDPADLLEIQLDTSADWAKRWRGLLTATLRDMSPGTTNHSPAELLEVLTAWEGRAGTTSVAYRVLRRWYRLLAAATLNPIFAESLRRDPGFSYAKFRYDPALWALHRDEPDHLLAPPFERWSELRQAAVHTLLAEIDDAGIDLTEYTWGEANRLRMQHPFARFLPGFLADMISMPRDPQAGDSALPRVARPAHGASLRLVVAPGQEADGILHLPGGQSGNPLSPFYRAGHEAWLQGDPTPFLPGPPVHQLQLVP